MSKRDLLLELYSNLGTTGAVTFSSKSLVKKMLSFTDLSEAEVIVELGGGDGSITEGIVSRMPSSAHLLVFEINESFCKAMRKQFPGENIQIINDSAENIHLYLMGRKADAIFSSLPFSLISKEATDAILTHSKNSLTPKGKFVQICYSYLLKNLFSKYFTEVQARFTLKNFPPAFVMTCH
ncbi:class I SAM-dependent methyltransferase [Algoriphagus confluentis]|uniref:rRNA adenine N-6-methyltransferase family protein n=1 Tax=Algoriphagus confluentis TaxID=1697556 RepID=A0ABQ6PKC6_9BACT|nr:rRNA adenine N-6-methyltransferase family protein [Algoriphagus confluentis]